MLAADEISKEDYDKWCDHDPEFDKAQNCVKVLPCSITEMPAENLR